LALGLSCRLDFAAIEGRRLRVDDCKNTHDKRDLTFVADFVQRQQTNTIGFPRSVSLNGCKVRRLITTAIQSSQFTFTCRGLTPAGDGRPQLRQMNDTIEHVICTVVVGVVVTDPWHFKQRLMLEMLAMKVFSKSG